MTYFAASGDYPGVIYPAASPNVIGVGGTSFSRDQIAGSFYGEAVWNDPQVFGTGGGPSRYEAIPAYQSGISQIVGTQRGTPDVAALADPYNAVWVYSASGFNGWGMVGGTSLATPLVAGMINRAGFLWADSFHALTNLYALAAQNKLSAYVTDINSGLCGPATISLPYSSTQTFFGNGSGYDPAYLEATYGVAWDWCTGWGTPRGSH